MLRVHALGASYGAVRGPRAAFFLDPCLPKWASRTHLKPDPPSFPVPSPSLQLSYHTVACGAPSPPPAVEDCGLFGTTPAATAASRPTTCSSPDNCCCYRFKPTTVGVTILVQRWCRIESVPWMAPQVILTVCLISIVGCVLNVPLMLPVVIRGVGREYCVAVLGEPSFRSRLLFAPCYFRGRTVQLLSYRCALLSVHLSFPPPPHIVPDAGALLRLYMCTLSESLQDVVCPALFDHCCCPPDCSHFINDEQRLEAVTVSYYHIRVHGGKQDAQVLYQYVLFIFFTLLSSF